LRVLKQARVAFEHHLVRTRRTVLVAAVGLAVLTCPVLSTVITLETVSFVGRRLARRVGTFISPQP
jgi:hypothetical protein